jgi:hypothetical protein
LQHVVSRRYPFRVSWRTPKTVRNFPSTTKFFECATKILLWGAQGKQAEPKNSIKMLAKLTLNKTFLASYVGSFFSNC